MDRRAGCGSGGFCVDCCARLRLAVLSFMLIYVIIEV